MNQHEGLISILQISVLGQVAVEESLKAYLLIEIIHRDPRIRPASRVIRESVVDIGCY